MNTRAFGYTNFGDHKGNRFWKPKTNWSCLDSDYSMLNLVSFGFVTCVSSITTSGVLSFVSARVSYFPRLVFHIFSATRSLQHMLNYMTLDNVCNSGYQIRCMMNYWNTVKYKEKISYVSHIRLDKKQFGSEIWLLICDYSVFVFLLKSIYGHSFFLPSFEDIIKARNMVPIFMLLNILFVYMFLYVVSFLSNLMVINVLFSLLIRDSCINSLVVFQLMFLNDVALLE
ncbi:hypothetical protein LXL04_013933 [Taraxacum kok-saghyz]